MLTSPAPSLSNKGSPTHASRSAVAPSSARSGASTPPSTPSCAGTSTARASAVWRLDETWRFRASWGQGFRAPSLFELNYDQFGVTPNPDLRPEKANGFDAGVEKLFGENRRQRLAVTFFQTRVDDQIDFDLMQNGYYNIDEARSRGVEVEGDFALSPRLSANLTYSFTDAIDLSTDTQLLRQPQMIMQIL